MKCCSLKRKDLNFHFKKMSHKYYMLNSFNDETLRQVYINSLPDELQAEIHRHMASTRRDLRNTSLSEIHQIAFTSLEKICDTQKLFSNMLKDKANISSPKKAERIDNSTISGRNSEEDIGPTIPSISK
ncbi:hypothetical protein ACOSP7_004057 [Xanthoceras sorbifolium]